MGSPSIATDSGGRPSSCWPTRTLPSPTSQRSGRSFWTSIRRIATHLEIEAKYDVYVSRQAEDIEALRRDESLKLGEAIDYAAVTGLSNEARQRLEAARPATIGQASRMDGMTPAALTLLIAHLRRRPRAPRQAAG